MIKVQWVRTSPLWTGTSLPICPVRLLFVLFRAKTHITPNLGTYSWTENGLTITVTNKIVNLTPDQIAQLKSNLQDKK